MNISVIGAGYVGLVTAAGLAELGHDVVCIDRDQVTVSAINNKTPLIHENGLSNILSRLVPKRLIATTDYKVITDTDLILICVGTPSKPDGSINLRYIKNAAIGLGSVLSSKKGYHVVATRSTIIPNTTKEVIIPIIERYAGNKVGFAYNPEFLQEGKAVQAFFNPQRLIIGELNKRAGNVLLKAFKDIPAAIFRTDLTTAEMIKYASNAFLATKISFINEIANICQRAGVDVYDVVKGLSFDYRIGGEFLNAGIGFGGSCLPKDVAALIYASMNHFGYRPELLRTVLDINEMQPSKMIDIAESKLGSLRNKTIAVLGLAFKPNTDDIRNAPAIGIIKLLLAKGAVVRAYDPQALDNAKRVFPQRVDFCSSAAEAIADSDCVLIATEWDEFKNISLYHGKMVIDGRRALEPSKAKSICDYQGVSW